MKIFFTLFAFLFSVNVWSQVSVGNLSGDRLELSGFQLQAQSIGNYLTFQADPAVSYLRYQICKTSTVDDSCINASTLFQSVEIPPSMGKTPTVHLWACITQAASSNPQASCTNYSIKLSEIPDLNGKRLNLLIQKETLQTQLNQHAHEAFLSIYSYLASDQSPKMCKFNGWNPDLTLDEKFIPLASMNPYILDNAFKYLGYAPSDSQLIPSSYQSSSGLQLVETGAPSKASTPQTWTEWFTRTVGNSLEASYFSIIRGEAFVVDIPNTPSLLPTEGTTHDLARLAYHTYEIGSSASAMSAPLEPQPRAGIWSYISSIPSMISSTRSFITTAADAAEKGAAVMQVLEDPVIQIRKALAELEKKYPEFDPHKDLAKITSLEFGSQDLQRWKKLVNDPNFVALMDAFDKIGVVIEQVPELRALCRPYLNMVYFLKSDDFKKLCENADAIVDLLITKGEGAKISAIGSNLLDSLRKMGVITQEFPKNWVDDLAVLIEATGVKDDDIKFNMDAIQRIVGDTRPLTMEMKKKITPFRTAIRERFDELKVSMISEQAIELENKLLVFGAMEPVSVNSIDTVNNWLMTTREILQSFTREMSTDEWAHFHEENSRALHILGVSETHTQNKSMLALAQSLQSKMISGANLLEMWPPRSPEDVNALVRKLIASSGTYLDARDFWDGLYNTVVGSASNNPRKIARRAALMEGLKLLNIHNGEDLFNYIFKIETAPSEHGLIQSMLFNEYEIQQKIQEAIKLQIPPEQRRQWAYSEVWTANEVGQKSAIGKIRGKLLQSLQVKAQTPILEGLSSRLLAAYLPEELKGSKYLVDAMKSGMVSYVNELAKDTSVRNPSPEIHHAERSPLVRPPSPEHILDSPVRSPNRVTKLLSQFRIPSPRLKLSGEPSNASDELTYREREYQRIQYAQYYRISGFNTLYLGVFASQLLALGTYQLGRSTGNCSDLKKTVSNLKIAQTQILSLQRKITAIEQQLLENGAN